MAVSAIVAGVGLAYSAYKGYKASQDEKKAKAEAQNLRRPFAKVQDEYYQNKNLLEEMATGGIPVDIKNDLARKRNEGLGTSLDALARSGANPNDFARINSIFDESLSSEAAQEVPFHIQNIRDFTTFNKDLAGQKTTNWAVNELQPYETKLKEIQDRRLADQENFNNAINEGVGYGSALATSLNTAKANRQDKRQRVAEMNTLDRTSGDLMTRNPDTNYNIPDPSINAPALNALNLEQQGGGAF